MQCLWVCWANCLRTFIKWTKTRWLNAPEVHGTHFLTCRNVSGGRASRSELRCLGPVLIFLPEFIRPPRLPEKLQRSDPWCSLHVWVRKRLCCYVCSDKPSVAEFSRGFNVSFTVKPNSAENEADVKPSASDLMMSGSSPDVATSTGGSELQRDSREKINKQTNTGNE